MNILSVSFTPCYARTKWGQQFHCLTWFSTPALRAWLHYNFLCCLHRWQVYKVPVWQFLMATQIIHGFSTSKEVSEVQHDMHLCASISWFHFLRLHCIFQHSEIQNLWLFSYMLVTDTVFTQELHSALILYHITLIYYLSHVILSFFFFYVFDWKHS